MPVTKPSRGDDLLRHAHKHGVSRQAVLSHPQNQELLAYRDPAVLSEDDDVFVPDPVVRTITVGTGETTYLVYKPQRRVLHLVLQDDNGEPRQADYTLCEFVFDGPKPKYGLPLPAQLYGFACRGVIHEELPIAVSGLTLILEDAPAERISINLGRLDPVSTTRGLKRRLCNLGLYHADVDSPVVDQELSEALRTFQRAHGMPVTGVSDAATRDKLRALCGG